MSKSSDDHTSGDTTPMPRAVIHKQILDAAAGNPEASLTELADGVGAASPELVERVLDEYGDPGENGENDDDVKAPPSVSDESTPAPDGEQQAEQDSPRVADPTLSARQKRTLEVVAHHPTATQAEIADELGVTAATVSNRLNAIPDFDWENRAAFVEQCDDLGSPDTEQPTQRDTMQSESPSTETVSSLESRIDALEETTFQESSPTSAFDDPDLMAKIIRASIDAEYISEDEELHIIRTFIGQ